MTLDELSASDTPVSPVMGMLLGLPPGDPRIAPPFTLTERPVADVVAEAGFGPVPQRIEITADFCQCAACKAERCEP